MTLNAQGRECEKYLIFEEYARRAGLQSAMRMGWMVGFLFVGIYAMNALGMWYGQYLIFEGEINTKTNKPFTGGDVITVCWALTMGIFGIMDAGPWFAAYSKYKPAIKTYLELANKVGTQESIEKSPGVAMTAIRSATMNNEKAMPFIKFSDVTFRYPSRRDNLAISTATDSEKEKKKVRPCPRFS